MAIPFRCAGLLLAAASLAADEPARWTMFIGRFHLVTLHLPIGLFAALAVVEIRAWWRGLSAADPARGPLVVATAAAAAVSVVCGLLLAQGGDYDPDQLFLHQWLGITTAGVSGLLVGIDRWQRSVPGAASFRTALLAGVALVAVTGHFGGNLTHGRGFLTRYAPAWLGNGTVKPAAPATPSPTPPPATVAVTEPEPPAPPPAAPEAPAMAEPAPMEAPATPAPMAPAAPAADTPPPAAEAISYSRQIAPILGERCCSCHGPDKQKGGLRLDTPAGIRSGGKSGGILLAGQPEKSTLYTCLILPEDDDGFMPAKGGPLKAGQIALIKQWIASGAPFEAAPPAAKAAAPEGTKPDAPAPAKGPTPAQTATGYDQLGAGLAAPDQRAIDALTEAGGVVRPLSKDGKVLEVNLSHTKAAADERTLQRVVKLGANVAWLDLAGTAITGPQLAMLRSLPNLQRLHLERTAIGDSALIQLLPMAKLEYLNLVSTQVSDAGLFRLKNLAGLRHLYLWQSKVTKAGAERIAADLPGCTVSNGP